LHDYTELSEQMLGLTPRKGDELASTAAVIEQLVTEGTSPSWVSASREAQLMGLAGWQYREFFSVLLPAYAELGVDGARDMLLHVKSDSRKAATVDRLHELYQDERLMAAVPIEL
jgi:hypothetical protein